MNFKVIGNRVVIKQLDAEEKTASGIVLPDSAKEKPFEGEVIAVGPGRVLENGDREDLQVKAGDRVIFSKFGGIEVKVDGENYLVLRQDDILIILEK
ncbi:co-chaperone GroES [endosymbiont 'TC1' of Trimyema compressum]|uniref:co-chaperone GroES n=1 Tax=endosymbiont 'TC1' of Trimyema compressum TaxID=243899 RepID=UPI0007F18501|nr:co-chaperone GroES [endosymbiont 'TC1' of Trimyema compressum]AMP20113.1 co-chaperone GroES [endosymbiont 'TC1' of Trimyema compressum]